LSVPDLEGWVTASVREVRTAAEGGGDAWDALLGRWHLRPPAAEARAARAAQLGVTRGALPEEVRVVLHGIRAVATARLEGILRAEPDLAAPAHPESSRVSQLRARLVTLVDDEGHAHDARVRPGRPGLGALFARARTTAALDPWAGLRWEQSLTVCCAGCGAPQASALVFDCPHCGGSVFGG
jgi:hypothetical protein